MHQMPDSWDYVFSKQLLFFSTITFFQRDWNYYVFSEGKVDKEVLYRQLDPFGWGFGGPEKTRDLCASCVAATSPIPCD